MADVTELPARLAALKADAEETIARCRVKPEPRPLVARLTEMDPELDPAEMLQVADVEAVRAAARALTVAHENNHEARHTFSLEGDVESLVSTAEELEASLFAVHAADEALDEALHDAYSARRSSLEARVDELFEHIDANAAGEERDEFMGEAERAANGQDDRVSTLSVAVSTLERLADRL